MQNFLTFTLAILTFLIWWQSFFQNNLVIYDKRLKGYQEFAQYFDQFLFFFERRKFLFQLEENKVELDDKEKEKLLQIYSKLEGIIFQLQLLCFSKELNDIFDEIKVELKKVCDLIPGNTFGHSVKRVKSLTEVLYDSKKNT